MLFDAGFIHSGKGFLIFAECNASGYGGNDEFREVWV